MPIVDIANSDQRFFMVALDKDGVERRDDPAGVMSERLVEELQRQPIRDVFIFSHGWMGDLHDAEGQYNAWFANLLADNAGRRMLEERRGPLPPLLVGIHWPSKPFGDEQFAGGGGAFATGATPAAPLTVEALTAAYRDRFADPARAEPALRVIFEHMRDDAAPYELSDELRAAFNELNAATGIGATGEVGDRPGDDREPFDPDALYYGVSDEVSFGAVGGGLLQAVGVLSFWQMKGRAATVGEIGANDLLRRMAAARPETRFHLVGHSFGCIVVSAMIASRAGQGMAAPVHSATLIQGALSCWAYGAQLPEQPTRSGYFHTIVRDGLVRGPLLSIFSRADRAVGWLYPIAAGVAGQYAFDRPEPQKYSALGAFGAQNVVAETGLLAPLAERYAFGPGQIYNLDGTAYIKEGGPLEGGHNDINHLEVSRAIWSAAATEA